MASDGSPFEKIGHMLTSVGPAFEKPFVASVPRPAIYADTTYKRLEAEIKDFEGRLAPDEEVGARLAHFGQLVTIAVESIGVP